MFEYHSIESPLGTLFLAATEAGLCRVAWHVSESEFVAGLRAELAGLKQHVSGATHDAPEGAGAHVPGFASGPALERLDTGLQEAAAQLGEYFGGRRREFALPLDFSRLRPFPLQVLTALLQVPYGEVVTYGGLAVLAGYPGAARAVGGVMRRNPLPIVIPCHRVLPSSGGLGGFGGRPDLKRRLLELEGWCQEFNNPPVERKQ